MPKIAAIEFDENVARVLVAKTTGSTFQLSSAFEVDFDTRFEDDAAEFGRALNSAIGNRIGRCDALVSLGRGLSEIRVINVPVVPDNELPEIVRFQAIRQFNNCTEDSPVDYLPLTESGEEKRVLAATVPKVAIDNLKFGCQAAGLTVKGIKLRGTCTTALSHSIDANRKNYIILDPADRSFNLEVIAYGKLCLTRTVRSLAKDQSTQIVREIRRTLAAANNQISDYEARSVVVFGDESDFEGLRGAIETDLQFEVEFINPFDHASGLSEKPSNAGSYASLVGLLVDYTSKATETIDWLNPRRKSSHAGDSRVKWLAAGAAAILLIGLIALGYLILAQKTNQIKQINDQIAANQKTDKQNEEIIANVKKIEKFENTQAVWLRELANLSEDFPDPDFAILNNITFTLDPNDEKEGVRAQTSGFLRGGEVAQMIRQEVRDDVYDTTIDDVVLLSQKEKTQDIYSHKFKAKVYRAPVISEQEVSEEKLDEFMAPRRELANKKLEEAQQRLAKQDSEGGQTEKDGTEKEVSQ